MIPFLTWCGFALTVSLVLLPPDVAAAFQLVAQIALGSVAGFVGFRYVTGGYVTDFTDSLKGLAAAVPAAAVFLFFDLYWQIAQAGIAAAVGISAVWITREWLDEWEYSEGTDLAARLMPVVMFLAWVGFTSGVVYAVMSGELPSITIAAGLILLGSAAICFAALTLVATIEGTQFTVEGHWGGLGGGLGGWRLSRTVVFLLLTLVFAGATAVVVANADLGPPPAQTVEAEPDSGAPTDPEDVDVSGDRIPEQATDESPEEESEEAPDEAAEEAREESTGQAE